MVNSKRLNDNCSLTLHSIENFNTISILPSILHLSTVILILSQNSPVHVLLPFSNLKKSILSPLSSRRKFSDGDDQGSDRLCCEAADNVGPDLFP